MGHVTEGQRHIPCDQNVGTKNSPTQETSVGVADQNVEVHELGLWAIVPLPHIFATAAKPTILSQFEKRAGFQLRDVGPQPKLRIAMVCQGPLQCGGITQPQ